MYDGLLAFAELAPEALEAGPVVGRGPPPQAASSETASPVAVTPPTRIMNARLVNDTIPYPFLTSMPPAR